VLLLLLALQDAGHLKMGVQGGRLVDATQEQMARLCADSVFEASRLEGGFLRTAGTLRQGDEGFTYESKPDDRLRLVFAEGSCDFFVTKIDGNLSKDAGHYLLKAHDFRFRVAIEKKVDLKVKSVRKGTGEIEETIAGTFDSDGVAYQCDLTATGTYSWSETGEAWQNGDGWGVSPKGFQMRVLRTLKGTLSAEGFSLAVDESTKYVNILFERFVENHTLESRNSWTAGGRKYALEKHTIRKSFLNTKVAELDFWIVSGAVVCDGKRVAKLGYTLGDADRGEPLRIFLESEKEKIPLEEWNR
jgi:hypothetical protein